MVEYIFNYNNNKIKYTIDLLGRERVFLNEQLVAKPTNWFNSVSVVEITVDNETLKLSRRIRSYTQGEYQITLSNSNKIIEKQSKLVIDLSTSGEETVYHGDEADWLDEVKLPQGVLISAWVLYFVLIAHTLLFEFTENNLVATLSAWGLVAFSIVSVGMFIYWTAQALMCKPTEDDLI